MEAPQITELSKPSPDNYGDTAGEYDAVRAGGAGLLNLSSRGRILISGTEAVMFLNGLITNDMKTLAPQTWMPAVFPNVQGRLLAEIRVIHREDGFLVDTERATHEAVLKLVERFTLAGDFRVADLTETTALVSIQGERAIEVVAAVLGEMPQHNAVATFTWQGAQLTVIRATHTAEDGFDLFVPAAEIEPLWNALIHGGATPVGSDAMETLRIEAGIARFGIDMDETNVVTETNLDDAVSFTKGCYIGQEIIARIKYRGHVAKKLAGILFDGEVPVHGGAAIVSADGKAVGRVTSATFSPRLGCTVALGYLKYDYLEPGTGVTVNTGEAQSSAQVAGLPFVRGSWYREANEA